MNNILNCNFRKFFQFLISTSLTIIFFSATPVYSLSADTTSFVIVGTVHNKTENFNNQTLFNIIEKIKPDLILVELDSSFFTELMVIKPEFVNISLENTVVNDYQKKHDVLIRPYDIEGRNNMYKENNYFEQQKELSKSLNKAIQDSLLSGETMLWFDAIIRFDEITQSFASALPEVFNSNACNVVMESKQHYANDGMFKIVTSVASLNKFDKFVTFKRDFWIKRNEDMIKNILYWNNKLKPKTMLILCGFEHKYYLNNSLLKHCKIDNFKLKEYWDF